jgi:hypothetical protein
MVEQDFLADRSVDVPHDSGLFPQACYSKKMLRSGIPRDLVVALPLVP